MIDRETGRFLSVIKSYEDLSGLATPEPTTGCLLWAGRVDKDGYGLYGRKQVFPERSAHRLAWFLTHGPIPKGLVVMHRCDQPSCIAVSHLRLGTTLENVADRHAKGRTAKPTAAQREAMRVRSLGEANLAHLSRLNARPRDAKGHVLPLTGAPVGAPGAPV